MTNNSISLIEELSSELKDEWPIGKDRRSLTYEDGIRIAIDKIRQYEAVNHTNPSELQMLHDEVKRLHEAQERIEDVNIKSYAAKIAEKANECCYRNDGYEENLAIYAEEQKRTAIAAMPKAAQQSTTESERSTEGGTGREIGSLINKYARRYAHHKDAE